MDKALSVIAFHKKIKRPCCLAFLELLVNTNTTFGINKNADQEPTL
jgi:hypothetical protein